MLLLFFVFVFVDVVVVAAVNVAVSAFVVDVNVLKRSFVVLLHFFLLSPLLESWETKADWKLDEKNSCGYKQTNKQTNKQIKGRRKMFTLKKFPQIFVGKFFPTFCCFKVKARSEGS